VALVNIDGPEKNTIQYAPDGIDFKPVASIGVPPVAPAPYCPDIFEDNGNGMGIKWGLSHIGEVQGGSSGSTRTIHSFLIRFDCDLYRDYENPYFKNPGDQIGRFGEETFFHPRMILKEVEKQKIMEQMETGLY